jgi:hypothetical protein
MEADDRSRIKCTPFSLPFPPPFLSSLFLSFYSYILGLLWSVARDFSTGWHLGSADGLLGKVRTLLSSKNHIMALAMSRMGIAISLASSVWLPDPKQDMTTSSVPMECFRKWVNWLCWLPLFSPSNCPSRPPLHFMVQSPLAKITATRHLQATRQR